MKWVSDFYNVQYDMMHLPSNLAYQKERIAHLKNFKINSKSEILELGGGMGEFAVAASMNGYKVTMIELVEKACEKALELAKLKKTANLNIICQDFYKLSSDKKYKAICYWDGFGIGTDMNQIELLNIMCRSLDKNGKIFIDIYSPWYWSKVDGYEVQFDKGGRQYGYNYYNSQMIDCWWENDKKNKVCQFLRCYSPSDLNLLLTNTNLQILELIPSGYMDYNEGKYYETKELGKCMSYLAVLEKKD